MGFDAQGDPLIVTGDGRFIVLTGPDAARTIGAASQRYGGAPSTLENGGVSADDPYAAVSMPGGGRAISPPGKRVPSPRIKTISLAKKKLLPPAAGSRPHAKSRRFATFSGMRMNWGRST